MIETKAAVSGAGEDRRYPAALLFNDNVTLTGGAEGQFPQQLCARRQQRTRQHLDPDAIARTYLHVINQHRSARTWEVELRPWVERF